MTADVGLRPDVPLVGSTRADVATRAVLARLRDVIRANEPGALAGVDVEHLHDLRVAVRRSRSLLGRSRDVLPRRKVERHAEDLRWLQEVTGPVRDLDVQLASLPDHRDALAPEVAAALAPLEALLADHRADAHRRLVKALRGDRWRKALDAWSAFVDAPADPTPDAPDARRPVDEVARAQVSRLHRRLLRDGRAIDAASPPDALHALRKRCKKLRYVLEAWRPVLDADAVDRVVKDLKALQALLGEHQDAHVQAAALVGAARELLDRRAPAETLLAIGVLVERLRAAQVDARGGFAETFAGFDTPKVARHVAALTGT